MLISACIPQRIANPSSLSPSASPSIVSSTPSPPYASPKIIGEWLPESKAISHLSPDITGKINGNNYLFTVTIGSDSHPSDTGIMILDIQNPHNPKQIAFIKAPAYFINTLELSGNYLYALTNDSLWILDVSVPSTPKEVTKFLKIEASRTNLTGNYIYISSIDGSDSNKMVVVDISDPLHPKVAGTPEITGYFKTYGSILAVLTREQTVNLYDMSDPAYPKILCTIVYPGYKPITQSYPSSAWTPAPKPEAFINIEISDKYLYIVNEKHTFHMLDISDPGNPHYICSPQIPLEGKLYLFNNKIYSLYEGMLKIVDVSDPLNTRLLHNFPDLRLANFVIVGNTMYDFTAIAIPENFGNNSKQKTIAKIRIFDISSLN
jgi:hypothetical protein